MSKTTIINDPIWGPIELDPVCIKIINTPQFQRLRFIKQLGGCSYVYPGACHTRFEHSIGTSYLAGKLGRELQKKIAESRLTGGQPTESPPEITERDILCLEISGLCHDLGHGPFSHMFHSIAGKDWKHEKASVEMFTKISDDINLRDDLSPDPDKDDDLSPEEDGDLSPDPDEDIRFIKELIMEPETGYSTRKEKLFLFETVANTLNSIDVDKWDYFSRDCHMLGLNHNFQIERTIKLAKVVKDNEGQWHISYPKTEWFNLFDMFYTRFTLHRRAYQHPVCNAVEMMITDALLKADKWLMFPPDAEKRLRLSESVGDMNAYLWVTDDVFHRIRALPANGEQGIEEAKEILNRIDRRDMYKLKGEKKITFRDNDPQKMKKITESLKKWIERNPKLQKNRSHLFETVTVKFNYGNGDKNPLENIKFYQGDESVNLCKEEFSAMLPEKFEQVYLQLYWKGAKVEDPDKEIMEAFNEMTDYSCDDGVVNLVTTKKANVDK